MKVAGMEAFDLIAALILAAVMNFVRLPAPFVIGVPGLVLVTLYFGKRNKPDRFLIHLIRYYLTPGHYSAAIVRQGDIYKSKIYEG
jgi:hypothetical protein